MLFWLWCLVFMIYAIGLRMYMKLDFILIVFMNLEVISYLALILYTQLCWGFSATDNWTLPINHAKNTKKKTPIRLGALVQRRPKTLRRENKYPCLSKTENTCEQCVLVVIEARSPGWRWSSIFTYQVYC